MLDDLLRLATEACPNSVLLVDAAGTIVLVNPAFERQFGFAQAEIVGKPATVILPAFASLPRASAEPRSAAACRRDGSTVSVHVTTSLVETSSGPYTITWVDDSYERVAFERLLADLTASFVTIAVEDVDAAIVEAQRRIVEALDLDRSVLFEWRDGDGEFVRVHRWSRVEHFAGRFAIHPKNLPWTFRTLSRGDCLVFSSPDEIPDPQDREVIRSFGTQSGMALPLFVRGRLAGVVTFGSLRAGRAWSDTVRGRLQVVAQVFANALARKATEAALHASEAQFRIVADDAPVMIWVTGPDKRCTWVNRQWVEFTGRSLEESLDDGWSESIHSEDRSTALSVFRDASDRRASFAMQYRLRRHDGVWRWIFDSGAPHYAPDGTFLGYLGSCIDISDERESKAQLEAALEELKLAHADLRHTQHALIDQERLHVLGQMASGIAHDINNALGPVSLYAATIRMTEPRLTMETHEYLNIIEQSVRDVAQTVDRLREFSRRRDASFEPMPVDLNDVLEQVKTITRARWKNIPLQRGITVELQTDLARDMPPILGDEAEIRGALVNLVFNALDAMPNGGMMSLRTRVEGAANGTGGRVVVEVVDTGGGMSDEVRRRCFEPFFTTKGERGTGLGLAMVYGAVKRHGADIDIETAPGVGTTIRIAFPSAAPIELPAAAGPRPANLQALRVLVIDDDPRLLKSLSDVLQRDGHSVVSARNGRSGIAAFVAAQHTPAAFDVVLTDLAMPDIDGGKVAARIKGTSSTPIILLTGWRQQLIGDAAAVSVDRVLSKPPRLEELREALAACCAGPRASA